MTSRVEQFMLLTASSQVLQGASQVLQGASQVPQGSSQVLQGASQIHEVFLKEYFPNWNVVYCSNTEEGCRAVADGTADCMLFSNYRITQTERLRKQYKLTVLPAWKGMNFVFATRRNEGELYHILNQTSSLVSPSAIESALLAYSWPEERFSLDN